jgi:hypothetical protein
MLSLKCINDEDVTDELTKNKIYKDWRYDDFEEFCHVKNDRNKWEIYCTDRFEMVEENYI